MNPNQLYPRIIALRSEAAEAGDLLQVVLCDVALGTLDYDDPADLDADGFPDFSGGGWTARELTELRRIVRLTREQALAECEAVLAKAEERAR